MTILYKYMKLKYLWPTLCNNSLRFSRPIIAFNDLFDGNVKVLINSKKTTLQAISKSYVLCLAKEPNNWAMWNLYTAVDDSDKQCLFSKAEYDEDKIINFLNEPEDLNSLNDPEDQKNKLEDRSKGIYDYFGVCLGFDTSKVVDCERKQKLLLSFLNCDGKKDLLTAYKVCYEDAFIKEIAITSDSQTPFRLPPCGLIKALTYKSKQWKHEQEYRIILIKQKESDKYYNSCCSEEPKLVSENLICPICNTDPNGINIKFNKEILKEVIFGFRTKEETKEKVKELIEKLGYEKIDYKEIDLEKKNSGFYGADIKDVKW